MFDKDKDGKISIHDLGGLMTELGQKPSEGNLKDMIGQFDENESGNLDFHEFLSLMAISSSAQVSEEEMLEMFQLFDANGNGTISKDELREAMKKLGEPLSEKEVSDLIATHDKNGDGVIDYKEFISMMYNK